MALIDYIPDDVREYIRLIQVRRRYPDAHIYTSYISSTAKIGRHCRLLPRVHIGNGVQLGDYSYVNKGTYILSGQLGKFCSIAPSVQIGMPEHPVNYLSTSPHMYGSRDGGGSILGLPPVWDDYQSPPSIGNDVWVGGNAIILQGVNVGHGAIIAAGAVVTKDVEPYTVVGGVPAKVLRARFSDCVVEHLLTWKWWDLPIDELKTYSQYFQSSIISLESLEPAIINK
jgi:virginiamycin A acetyltransferase